MHPLRTLTAALCLSALAALPARAQQGPPLEGWDIAAGAGTVSGPRSLGSDGRRTLVVPSVNLRYRDWFFANPVGGVGVATRVDGAELSAAIAPDFNERDPEAGGRQANLAKVAMAPALRLRGAYEVDGFALEAVVSSRIANRRRNGTTLSLEAGHDIYGSAQLQMSAGLGARLMDSAFARNFASVSASDAARSGLAPYRARAGLLDAGPFAQAIYALTPRWTAFTRLEVDALLGDAKRSPVVERRTAPKLLLFVNYTL